MPSVPFEKLYITVIGDKKRTYTKLSTARAQITSNSYRINNQIGNERKFQKDCELWEVGNEGWSLLFESKKDEPLTEIDWKTSYQSKEEKMLRYQEEEKQRKEQQERELFLELQKKYGGE